MFSITRSTTENKYPQMLEGNLKELPARHFVEVNQLYAESDIAMCRQLGKKYRIKFKLDEKNRYGLFEKS